MLYLESSKECVQEEPQLQNTPVTFYINLLRAVIGPSG